MEDVLDLYEEPYEPNEPVVCFEELPYQMVAEKRKPLPQKPGRPKRYDYEYERKGMLNIFAFFEPKSGWRHLDITERRTAVDFASAMRRLVDEHYPTTEKVRVVLDNLNTHSPASLYKAFEPEEARRLLRRLEFHHTPTHASWLNMVEIESSSRCSLGSVWSVASPMPRGLQGRLEHGSTSATKERRRCNGASRHQTLGRSWHDFTRHNRSGGVLVRSGAIALPGVANFLERRICELP